VVLSQWVGLFFWSLPGLTRQSIFFEKFYEDGWMPGSSPGMTSVGVAYRHQFQTAPAKLYGYRHCERSEAIHFAAMKKEWIASSLRSSQ
jgi:hypothetical protein